MLFLIVFIACFTAADAACSCEPYRTVKEAFCKSDYECRRPTIDAHCTYVGAPTAMKELCFPRSKTFRYLA
ncbi:hypothetical protein Y032_0310g2119 [Ancylostoma ceylanicum]|uniref:Uncharacterized protein n=1 Tax=Ancylostoma ceylanicum TaxID=53326 RepID=A0A016S3H2_9BILA|nr:hypothetical protein Y032_0310g2119 [Ancylostoma ceylanicum]